MRLATRAAAIGIVLLAIGFPLFGCGLRSPAPQDIVGRWTSEKGGELVFAADGRFVGVAYPLKSIEEMDPGDVLLKTDNPVPRVSVSGTWRLGKPGNRRTWLDYWAPVELEGDKAEGYPAGWTNSLMYNDATEWGGASRQRPVLQFWLRGDLDGVVEYRKQ